MRFSAAPCQLVYRGQRGEVSGGSLQKFSEIDRDTANGNVGSLAPYRSGGTAPRASVDARKEP